MAVYFDATNVSYNPMSFDDMVKPLNMYQAKYDAVQDKIDNLSEKSGLAYAMFDPIKDKDAYEKSLAYQKSLNDVIDNFDSDGLSGSVANLNNLRRRYHSDILPYINAKSVQNKQIEQFQKDYNKGLYWNYDPSESSVSEFVGGNIPTHDTYNLKDKIKGVETKAKAASAGLSQHEITLSDGMKFDISGIKYEHLKEWVDGNCSDQKTKDALDKVYNDAMDEVPEHVKSNIEPYVKEAIISGAMKAHKEKVTTIASKAKKSGYTPYGDTGYYTKGGNVYKFDEDKGFVWIGKAEKNEVGSGSRSSENSSSGGGNAMNND